MFLIRTVEEGISSRYDEALMRCPVHLSIGQEAVPSVISEFMTSDDTVVSTHRSHAHYIAKGGSIRRMLCELYGKEDGCSHGRGGSMHLTDKEVGFIASTAIVGNTIPIGVGLSYKNKIDKSGNFSCIYLGDAATEEGVFYESVNFAAVHKLPCLFICENNNFSVYSDLKDRQPSDRKIFRMVESLGVKSSCCDGNDILILHDHIKPIIERIRCGEGPFFVECMTYRTKEHCGPNNDNELGYRRQEEASWWAHRDPLKLAELWGRSYYGLDVFPKEYKIKIKEEIDNLFGIAENADYPDPDSLHRDTYASLN